VPLLELDRVTVNYRPGRPALREVTLQVESGEVVGILGRRRSGRTTLLRVAAGALRATSGTASFHGVDLAKRPVVGTAGTIAHADREFSPLLGDTVLAQVAAPLLARRMSLKDADAAAGRLLSLVGADDCVLRAPAELNHAETIRVALARALTSRPRLLLIDEPVNGVSVPEVAPVLQLVRSIADQDGIAMLMTVGHASELSGVDRALILDEGELRGETRPKPPGTVVPLPSRAERTSA
jgi:ABC-type multidrug transport system ATPase subunit